MRAEEEGKIDIMKEHKQQPGAQKRASVALRRLNTRQPWVLLLPSLVSDAVTDAWSCFWSLFQTSLSVGHWVVITVPATPPSPPPHHLAPSNKSNAEGPKWRCHTPTAARSSPVNLYRLPIADSPLHAAWQEASEGRSSSCLDFYLFIFLSWRCPKWKYICWCDGGAFKEGGRGVGVPVVGGVGFEDDSIQ